MPDNVKKNISKTKVDYYADLKKLNNDNNNDNKRTIPNSQLPFDKQKKIIPKISTTKKEDSNLENIIEVVDPTGITSWDDIARSYKKEGLSGNTLLEIAGAIPLLGKMGKATKAGIHLKKYSGLDKSLYKTLPKNNILSNTIKTTAVTGRTTDVYQAGEQIYNQYQNGGTMNKPKNIPTWNYPSLGTPIHPTQSVPFALGGRMYNQGGSMEQLTEFNEGGSHESNPMNGVPQGTNAQGQMNLVEEGETKLNSKDYIFSDSLKVDKETAQAFNLPSSSNGKTFAEVSKGINSKNSFRKNDTIDSNHKTKLLDGLMEAQEAYKMKQAMIKMQELQALLPQGMASMGQFAQPQDMGQQMPTEQPMEQPMEGQGQIPQEIPTIEQMRYGGNMYAKGGLIRNWQPESGFMQGVKNYGMGVADTALTTLGASNVIEDHDYSGTGSKLASGWANVVGGAAGAALPAVAGLAGGPGAAAGVSAVQGVVGGLNPEATVDRNGNPLGNQTQQQIGKLIGATGGMAGSFIGALPPSSNPAPRSGAIANQPLTEGDAFRQSNQPFYPTLTGAAPQKYGGVMYNNGGYMNSVQFAEGGFTQDGDPPYYDQNTNQTFDFGNNKRTRSLTDSYDIAIPEGRTFQQSIFAYTPEEQAIVRVLYEQNPDLTDEDVQQLFPQGLKNISPKQALDVVDNAFNPNVAQAEKRKLDLQEVYINSDGSLKPDAPRELFDNLTDDEYFTAVEEGKIDAATGQPINNSTSKYGQNADKINSDAINDINIKESAFEGIGKYAPVIGNLALGAITAFQKPQQLKYEDYMNKGNLQAYKMNIDPQLRAVAQASTGAKTEWKANSRGAQYLAGLNSLANQEAMQRAQLYANKENTDNANQMQADQFNIGLQSQNLGQKFQVDDWNARSKTAKQQALANYFGTAANQIGQVADTSMRNKVGLAYAQAHSPTYKFTFDSYLGK